MERKIQHELLNKALFEKITQEIGLEEALKEKRPESHSSLNLLKFLDAEIEAKELHLKNCEHLDIVDREPLQKQIKARIELLKQLEYIVQVWSANTKPAKQ